MRKQIFAAFAWISLAAMATTFARAADPSTNVAPPVPPVTVASQPATAPTTAAPVSPAEVVSSGKPEVKPAETATEPIVIDYSEADIQSVLRTMAARAGINLILGDEVMGKVTIHLENVPYEDAMELIAESKGYAYIRDKNVARVKSRESIDAEPVEIRLLTLNYAKADDIKKTIDPVLTKQGKVQVDARSNTLILSDIPSNLAKLMPLLAALDTQTPQVMIEAKFIETIKNPQKDLGINWANTALNHTVTVGSPATSSTGSGGSTTVAPPADFQATKGVSGVTTPWYATALLDIGTAQAVFSFFNQDADSELLANPRIVTTDNNKAKISIATQFPIPQFAFSQQTGGFQITGFDYKDIGIILNVLPRINKNEFVTLEVTPEASSSSQNATLTSGSGNAVQIPIINTRTATTTVLIKSGNTLAIGGLMRRDVSDSYTKVPLLGDMPGIGPLFRSKSLSKTKRDLLIFLTPTIVGPNAKTGYEQYSGGFPPEQVYANDKWMPKDNAKPRSVTTIFGGDSSPAPTQNFGP